MGMTESTEAPVRVLIADDAPDIRLLLKMYLSDSRLEVVGEATNGAEAVELTRAQLPDAVILDLAMPVMDGLEAIPLIKAASPNTKIVVLSGFEADRMAERAIDLGADSYLQKGVALGDISQMLWNLCRSAA
jgi:YesN/AraC family two-component response regulator